MIRSTRFACGRFTSLSLSPAILFLLTLLLDRSPASPRGATEGKESSPSGSIRVIQSDRDGVVFEVIPPSLELLPTGDAQNHTVALEVSGYRYSTLPGLPEVPQTTIAIGLPPGATAALEIVDADSNARHVGRVAPALTREVINFDGVLRPDFVPQFTQRYEMDVTAYKSDQLYPPMSIQLGDVTWLRGVRQTCSACQ